MPNSYDLYLGGGRTANPDTRMFPSYPYNPTSLIKSADHKSNIGYAITRVLDTSPTAPVTSNGTVGDAAVRNWLDFQALSVPIAAGDILHFCALPNGCIFDGFFWEVTTPLTGFTFSVGYARIGNGAYTTGMQTIPNGTIGTILLATQSGAAVASGFVDSNGTPMVADTPIALKSLWVGGTITAPTAPSTLDNPPPGDCLCLRLDAIPTPSGVSGAAVFANLRMKISPIVRELVRGQW